MIEFRRGRHRGRGIILDRPSHGVIGIVECATDGCEWRFVLTVENEDPESMADAVDRFLETHPCGREPAS